MTCENHFVIRIRYFATEILWLVSFLFVVVGSVALFVRLFLNFPFKHASFNDEVQANEEEKKIIITTQKSTHVNLSKKNAAHIFLLFDGSAKKGRNGRKIYTQYNKRYVWIGEAPGATQVLMARIC